MAEIQTQKEIEAEYIAKQKSYTRDQLIALFHVNDDVEGHERIPADEVLHGYHTWVCPKCGHLMDGWDMIDTQFPHVFKCGASRENLFDGIHDGECSMAVVREGGQWTGMIKGESPFICKGKREVTWTPNNQIHIDLLEVE